MPYVGHTAKKAAKKNAVITLELYYATPSAPREVE